MSSIGKPSPDQVYSQISEGLTGGKRIVYNKQTGKFETKSRDEAKKLSSNDDYITDLKSLRTQVETYIRENGISTDWQQKLANAFDARAKKLAGRFVLFGGSQRDQAVKDLQSFSSAINTAGRASLAAQSIFRSGETESQSKSLFEQGEQTRAPPPLSREEGKVPFKSQVSGKQEETEADIFDRPATEKKDAGQDTVAAPPPPSRGPGAPPPPPGGPGKAKGPQMTSTHRDLTKQMKLFENEPAHPKLESGHDLGKINAIPEEKRNGYAAEIEKYVKGEKKTKLVTKLLHRGGSKQVEETTYEGGMQQVLKPLEEELTNHAKDLETLEGLIAQRDDLSNKMERLSRAIAMMRTANTQDQSFILYTPGAQKNTTGIPVTLLSDTEYAEYVLQFEHLSEDEKILLKNHQLGPENIKENTINHQMQIYNEKINELFKERDAINQEIDRLQAKIDKRNQLTNNGIPFNQWGALVQEKSELMDRWLRIGENMRKGDKAPPESTQSNEENLLNNILSKVPAAALQQTFLKSIPHSTMPAYAKDHANFYGNLVSDNGR